MLLYYFCIVKIEMKNEEQCDRLMWGNDGDVIFSVCRGNTNVVIICIVKIEMNDEGGLWWVDVGK